MSDLMVLTFDNEYAAAQAMSAVRALTEMRYAWIDDVAIVERHKSGRVTTHTTHGSVTGGALWGGLVGMFVGLLWPPLGFLAWWGAGMGVGALMGKATKEAGLDKSMLDEVKNAVTPGTSALILIGASGDADQMAHAFEPYHPVQVIRHELPEQTVENLKKSFEAAPTEQDVHGES